MRACCAAACSEINASGAGDSLTPLLLERTGTALSWFKTTRGPVPDPLCCLLTHSLRVSTTNPSRFCSMRGPATYQNELHLGARGCNSRAPVHVLLSMRGRRFRREPCKALFSFWSLPASAWRKLFVAVCMLSAHYVAKGVPTLLSTLGRKERTRSVTYAAWKKQDDR